MDGDLPVLLTPSDVLKDIAPYFPKEWQYLTVDDVSVDRIQAGHNNAVYIVKTDKVKKEPSKLIVRRYGGRFPTYKEFLSPCTETEELIITCQLASQGLAPRLYGFFEGGRIEEYIDSRPPTDEDLTDPNYQIDLAKNFARFHRVELPLPKPKFRYIDVLRDARVKTAEARGILISNHDMQEIHHVITHDWDKELDFLEPLLEPSRHRIVFIVWGGHPQNIGVMNNPKDGQLKSFLFDYEMCCYNLRGRDFGQTMPHLTGSSFMLDKPFPTNDQLDIFVKSYMEEGQRLFDDWDPTGKDSFDHIMMESLVGGMIASIEWLSTIINSARGGSFPFPLDMTKDAIKNVQKQFVDCKEQLMSRYPNFERDL